MSFFCPLISQEPSRLKLSQQPPTAIKGIIQLHKKLMFELKLRRSFRLNSLVRSQRPGPPSHRVPGNLQVASMELADETGQVIGGPMIRVVHSVFVMKNLQILAGINSDNLG
jgi:hypothetical protein